MIITRVQALAIALGLALVGIAAARGDLAIFRSSGGIRMEAGRTLLPDGDLRLGIARDGADRDLIQPHL